LRELGLLQHGAHATRAALKDCRTNGCSRATLQIVAEITGTLSRGLIDFAAAKLTDERWAKGFLVEPEAVDIWSCGRVCDKG
jgi:hypothetical protein